MRCTPVHLPPLSLLRLFVTRGVRMIVKYFSNCCYLVNICISAEHSQSVAGKACNYKLFLRHCPSSPLLIAFLSQVYLGRAPRRREIRLGWVTGTAREGEGWAFSLFLFWLCFFKVSDSASRGSRRSRQRQPHCCGLDLVRNAAILYLFLFFFPQLSYCQSVWQSARVCYSKPPYSGVFWGTGEGLSACMLCLCIP